MLSLYSSKCSHVKQEKGNESMTVTAKRALMGFMQNPSTRFGPGPRSKIELLSNGLHHASAIDLMKH